VLMPNNPSGGGVSRRIEGEDRSELRDVLAQLSVRKAPASLPAPRHWSLAGGIAMGPELSDPAVGCDDGASKTEKAPSLIYLESSLVVRAIRDYFHPEIGEILIDTDEIYEQALAFMSTVMPDNVNRIKRYQDDVPLFSRFQIEHQIESAMRAKSACLRRRDRDRPYRSAHRDRYQLGRSTRGADIETTAFNTNLEAAEEIARQIRLRDLAA